MVDMISYFMQVYYEKQNIAEDGTTHFTIQAVMDKVNLLSGIINC